jgi:diguanylate cyclase (GGDEF)-like protein
MKRKSSILFAYTIILLFLMSVVSFYSIYVTSSISNDAMIINKLGIVRGAMQRAVKLELSDLNNNEMISKVDMTLSEFKTEKIKLFDKDNEVMESIQEVEVVWTKVKVSMQEYRKSRSEESRLQLIKDSEDGWYKANNMVLISQISSEHKISKFKLSFVVFFFNIVLSILIIILIKKYVKDSLEDLVNYDSLTNIHNRRSFTEFLHHEIIRCERYKKVFSIIMLDIDYFKKVNDGYGHDVGDEILKELVGVVSRSIRKSDLFARVGGEEFAVIAPETSSSEAMLVAEKIRKNVEEYIFSKNIKVTVSLGISQYKINDDQNTIFKRADNALYKAKGNGRNRSEVE